MDLSQEWNPVPKPIKKKYVKGAKRNDFPLSVRKQKKKDTKGICEYCQSKRANEMHHVIRRRKGRGVYTNAIYLCWYCHTQIIHKDRKIENKLVIEYEKTYGKYFFLDFKDIEAIPKNELDKKALRIWEVFNKEG